MKKTKRIGKTKEQLLAEMASKQSGGVKISACWIVKNDAENLRRSIESVKNQVDELIVVDTGSTDDTIETARSLGAQVFEQPWANDFSAPRNLALEHANGDWIVFLDADEYFVEAMVDNLRPSIMIGFQQKRQALLINLVNIDVDDHSKVIDSTYLCRAFRRLQGIHYVGRIHEELRTGDDKPLTKTLMVPSNVLTINHTGYSKTINRAKAQRNLDMLLAELERTDEPERIYVYLAQCYNGLDDEVNAEKYARLAIENGSRDSTFASSPHRILIHILSRTDSGRLSERLAVAKRAVEDFPTLPEFRAELAECLAASGEYERAVVEMKTALRNFSSYRGVEPMLFDQEMADLAAARIEQWSKNIGGQS